MSSSSDESVDENKLIAKMIPKGRPKQTPYVFKTWKPHDEKLIIPFHCRKNKPKYTAEERQRIKDEKRRTIEKQKKLQEKLIKANDKGKMQRKERRRERFEKREKRKEESDLIIRDTNRARGKMIGRRSLISGLQGSIPRKNSDHLID